MKPWKYILTGRNPILYGNKVECSIHFLFSVCMQNKVNKTSKYLTKNANRCNIRKITSVQQKLFIFTGKKITMLLSICNE